jgi:uncharacterized protein (TIGR02444 family)
MGGPDQGLWAWALEAYARPGVAEACLELQDAFGQSVPYLLWAAWAAEAGPGPGPSPLKAAADLARRWEVAATGPLRAARRALKASTPGVADAAREALRAEVKALELKSERLLMEALEGLAPARGPSPADDLRQALAAAVRAWPHPAPKSALERLARTLS